MSTGSIRRLKSALDAGKEIEQELTNSLSDHALKFSDVKEFNLSGESGVYCLHCNNEGTRIAVGLGSGGLQIFSLETLERIRKMRPGSIFGLPITCLKYYPCMDQNLLISASSSGSISAWEMDSLRHKETISETGNEITALDFSNDGKVFATTGKDKNVRIYTTDEMQLTHLYRGIDPLEIESGLEEITAELGHGQKVFALRFHPEDKDVFLTAGWDHCLKIWDIRVGSAVRTIHGPFVCGDGLDICGNEILTASWLASDALQIWDYGSGKVIETLSFPVPENHGQYLYCGRFWDARHILIGGSGVNDLKLINRVSKNVVDELNAEQRPVQAIDANTRHNTVVFGTSSSLLKKANITKCLPSES